MRFSTLEATAIRSLLSLNDKLVGGLSVDKTRPNPVRGAEPYYMPKCAKKSLTWDELKTLLVAIRAAIAGIAAAKNSTDLKKTNEEFNRVFRPLSKHFNAAFIDVLCTAYNCLGGAAGGFNTDHYPEDL